MLPDINLLYLGTSVLLILDNSYMSRFWTSWGVAYAQGDATGFDMRRTPRRSLRGRRACGRCIHAAKEGEEGMKALLDTWLTKSAEEARRSSRSQTCSSRTRRIKRCSS